MNILLASATDFEVDMQKNLGSVSQANVHISSLVTGVGLPNAMYQLTKAVLSNNYDFIIQAGIAGTVGHRFELGSVVIVKEDMFADVGINENGKFSTLSDNGFEDKNAFPYIDGWLKNSNIIKSGLPQCRGITVNTVTNNKVVIADQTKLFNADVESMEGAALHYVCLMHQISFLQLRSISNVVGEREKSKWQIITAIKNLNEALPKILNTIISHT